jgi:acyl-CoA hydrolase
MREDGDNSDEGDCDGGDGMMMMVIMVTITATVQCDGRCQTLYSLRLI